MRTGLVCTIALAACGGDAATPDAAQMIDAPHAIDVLRPIDAPAADLSCSGQPIPTTAPDPLAISGTVFEISALGATPTAGVTVDVRLGSNDADLGSATSDAQGAYSLSVATQGMARVGYVVLSKAGYVDSYGFGATAAYQDIVGADDAIVTAQTMATLAQFAEVTQGSGAAILEVRAIDCKGMPVAGATITTTPAGQLVYAANGLPQTTATATDSGGIAFVFNVPPGDVTVSGTLGSATLRAHVVTAFADSPTFTDLQP